MDLEKMKPGFLLLLAIPILFVNLGANSIWDANEAFYVETPRQMVLTGDYVNPTFNALPRFNKPVLSYWMVAGAYRLFGVSVGAERVVIALGALGILLGAFLIGRALRSPPAGALAALLLATSPRLIFFARRIVIDVWLAAFMTLALACFVLAERSPEHRRRYLLLMYVALGLGVLTKGPIAIAIPAVTALVWLITERRLGDLRRLMIPAGIVVMLVIVVPWYAAIYWQHGWEYIRFFFIEENLGRYANPLTTERSPLFFLIALLGDLLMPWAPLVAVALVAMWRRRRAPDGGDPIRRLLWWYVATTLAVFSFSASKEDLYILPAIPAAAVLIADLLIAASDGFLRRGVQWTMAAIAVVAVVLAVLVALFFTSGHYHLRGAWVLAVILGLTGIVTIVSVLRGRVAEAVVGLAAGFVLFNYVFVIAALPDVERLKPVPVLARTLQDRAAPAAPIATLSVNLPSLVYYANRPVARMWSTEDAARFVSDQKEAWMIVGEGDWTDLQRLAPRACIATRTPLFLAKGSDIVRGQAPADVLLITNKCQ